MTNHERAKYFFQSGLDWVIKGNSGVLFEAFSENINYHKFIYV